MSTANTPPGTGSSCAYSPIHRTIACGSVKKANTRSGSASMWTDARSGSRVIFDRGLQPLEAARPELGQERLHGREPFGADHVQAALPGRPHGDQTRVVEYLEVLGDG